MASGLVLSRARLLKSTVRQALSKKIPDLRSED